MLAPKIARFSIGQIVAHEILQFRGVIVDIDFYFLSCLHFHADPSSSNQYKNQLWYHVLVENTSMRIYVPESDLRQSDRITAINHPSINDYFSHLKSGIYQTKFLIH
jgi:heat shock protein HspQ